MNTAPLKNTIRQYGQWGFDKLVAPVMRAIGRRLLSWSASANVQPPETGAGQWKEKALEDFSAWLNAAPEAESDPDTLVEACDLYTLLTEFAALRQEITRQTRQQRNTLRSQEQWVDRFRDIDEQLAARIARLDQVHEDLRQDIEKATALPFLDIRDALVRGETAAGNAARKRGFLRRPPKGMDAVLEGYRMALRRFDRALDRLGIRPIPTTGLPFDPDCMRAVEKRDQADLEPGVVLAEVLGGFTRGDDILRTAEVVVNSK